MRQKLIRQKACNQVFKLMTEEPRSSINSMNQPHFFLDLQQCPICEYYVPKNQYRDHVRQHKYDEDGRFA